MSRLADLGRRIASGLDVTDSRAEQILQNLVPVLLLDSLLDEEDTAAQVEYSAEAGGTVTAAGGNFSQFQIFNPAGSGVLAVVEEVLFATSGGSQINMGFRDNAVTAAFGNDNQSIINNASIRHGPAVTSHNQQAATLSLGGPIIPTRFSSGANRVMVQTPGLIIPPGVNAIWEDLTADTVGVFYARWRERLTIEGATTPNV